MICRSSLATLFLGLFLGGGAAAADLERSAGWAAGDRVLVLAPHPDDEVICCGGLLQRAVARGIPVEIAFLTYGDANEGSFLLYRRHPVLVPRAVLAMGEVRRREALAAAELLGVPAERLTFLGYPDRGTLDLWTRHWAAGPPGRGLLTRAQAVPYATAFRPGAPYRGEEVLADLAALLRRFRPTQVFVSHPADHHPDHAALYRFTRAALEDLRSEMPAIQPKVHLYLVHFPDWPAPAGALASAPGRWLSWPLTAEEVVRKRLALAAHHSQWRSKGRRLLPFVQATEITEEAADGG